MVVRCLSCKKRYDLSQVKCPNCGNRNLIRSARETNNKPKPLSEKQRRRNAAERTVRPTLQSKHVHDPRTPAKPVSFPARLVGQLSGLPAQRRLSDGSKWWYVHIGGDIPEDRLVDHSLEWERVSIEEKYVVIRPMDNAWVRKLRRQIGDEHRAFLLEKVGPRQEGVTSIEQQTSLFKRGQEINRLATVVDRPHAWADIASCWRIETLQRPIKTALSSIGWEKISWLVHATPGWHPVLVELVDKELAKKKATRHIRPWHPDDHYLLDDY